MKFTHLHVHSHYSLLDGLAKIEDLIEHAKKSGMDSLALTDHGVLYGAVEFFIKAKKSGIKPIIGCETYIAPNGLENKNPTAEDRKRYHLILLVKNEAGYKNLMKLVSIAHLDGFYYKPRIDKKVLRENSEGLIGMSACIEGEVPANLVMGKYDKAKELALEYEDIFGKGNFFLEVQHHPGFENQKVANKGLFQLSKETGIPVVATGDIHYIHKEDAAIQDILVCIQTNRKVQEKDRITMVDFDLSMKSAEEIMTAFKDNPEVLENTQKVVDLCQFELQLGSTLLPKFEVPAGHTPQSYLRYLCEEGLKKRFGNEINDQHRERMEYELDVIKTTGFDSYFLIVQDFVNWAKDQEIVVGPGRGSAAGSFVSYLLNITNIDPIKYDLLFERFLNPERVSMPDIDMDFADNRRDEVLGYVRKKYGDDHVAQIITFGTMAARAAIRDAGRAMGYPYDYCDKAAKFIPMFSSIEGALQDVKEFKDFYTNDQGAKKLIDSAKKLEGVARHASMHACGVVITPLPVTEYSPLQRITGKKEGMVTQYSSSTKESYVDKIGLLKMDFLGLRNLTIIQNTIRIIKEIRNVNIQIDDIPLDDQTTYELLQRGETTGVFQLESSGMKRYLKKLKPTVLEDLIAMVALYRPGPMDWIPDFIDRKHGKKEMKYLHPSLKPILEKTYGVAVYQEQVMQIARDMAGFTLGEADVLRKAMGKKIPELIKEQRIKFVAGCVDKGVKKEVAEKVFAFIEPFAGYGFNRSHAACYALIGYQTAYLKSRYPAEFMAALLTADQDNLDRVAIDIDECRRMGTEVLPPHVNESNEDFVVVLDPTNQTETIRFGLNAIKNVGENVASEIVAERKRNGKFKDFSDFINRVSSKDMNKRSIDALAKVGAFSGFADRNVIIASMEKILSFAKNIQQAKNSSQTSLFGESDLALPQIQLDPATHASTKEKLAWEKELLGLYISDHPVKEYQEYLERVSIPIRTITQDFVGKNVSVSGVITKIHKIILKNQSTMLFAAIEDMGGKMEILVFPKTLEQTQSVWSEDLIVTASGKISDKDGSFKLLCDSAKIVNQEEVENFKRILATQNKNGNTKKNNGVLISLPNDTLPEIFQKLSSFFERCNFGDTKIYLSINNQKLETPYSINYSDAIRDSIKEIVPTASIE